MQICCLWTSRVTRYSAIPNERLTWRLTNRCDTELLLSRMIFPVQRPPKKISREFASYWGRIYIFLQQHTTYQVDEMIQRYNIWPQPSAPIRLCVSCNNSTINYGIHLRLRRNWINLMLCVTRQNTSPATRFISIYKVHTAANLLLLCRYREMF